MKRMGFFNLLLGPLYVRRNWLLGNELTLVVYGKKIRSSWGVQIIIVAEHNSPIRQCKSSTAAWAITAKRKIRFTVCLQIKNIHLCLKWNVNEWDQWWDEPSLGSQAACTAGDHFFHLYWILCMSQTPISADICKIKFTFFVRLFLTLLFFSIAKNINATLIFWLDFLNNLVNLSCK